MKFVSTFDTNTHTYRQRKCGEKETLPQPITKKEIIFVCQHFILINLDEQLYCLYSVYEVINFIQNTLK